MKARNLITLLILFVYANVFSQIKTETQYITLETGNPSLTITLSYDGVGVETKISNSSPDVKYDFSYSVEYELTCGSSSSVINDEGTVTYDKPIRSLSKLMNDCVSNGKRTANSVKHARLTNFKATSIQNEKGDNITSNGGNNAINVTQNSRPPANASVQELAEWQRKQYGSQPAQQPIQKSNDEYQSEAENKIQLLKNNNGASMAKLQQIIDDNNKRSEQLYGIKSYSSDAELANDLSDGVSEIVGLINANREIKRKEEERKKRAEEAERLRQEEIKMKIAMRHSILAEFPVKEIPLSSKEKAGRIYYFLYAYDNSINNQFGAVVYVSNVFEIGKYKDGTWPYTSMIQNEIQQLTPFDEKIHGYYYSENEAEELRSILVKMLKEYDVTILDFSYKGKPLPIDRNTGEKNNYSETKLTPASVKNESKYGKTINMNGESDQNNQNPASTQLNTNTKNGVLPNTAIERETKKEKKEENKYGKTIKID